MKSIYTSTLTKQVIWTDFIQHFKSATTAASYQADIDEIQDYFKKDFLEIGETEVRAYFEYLEKKVKKAELAAGTMAKKFRELHSFSQYICENRERYHIESHYQDVYAAYLRSVARQEKLAKSVPVKDMDRLFDAAGEDLMAYTILTLLYRAGMTSTEIIKLRREDLAAYEDGVYAAVEGRRMLCFIPEDAGRILQQYLEAREENPYLFYNKRGKQLNTMYISRMMKKYTQLAGIPSYSAESIRNSCGFNLFAYGAEPVQVAGQLGTTTMQIQRYKGRVYQSSLQKQADSLVKIRVLPPSGIVHND